MLSFTSRKALAGFNAKYCLRRYARRSEEPILKYVARSGPELVTENGEFGRRYDPRFNTLTAVDIQETDFLKLYEAGEYIQAIEVYESAYLSRRPGIGQYITAALEIYNHLELYKKTIDVKKQAGASRLKLLFPNQKQHVLIAMIHVDTESDVMNYFSLICKDNEAVSASQFAELVYHAYKKRAWLLIEYFAKNAIDKEVKHSHEMKAMLNHYIIRRVQEASGDYRLVQRINRMVGPLLIEPSNQYYEELVAFTEKLPQHGVEMDLAHKLLGVFGPQETLTILYRTRKIELVQDILETLPKNTALANYNSQAIFALLLANPNTAIRFLDQFEGRISPRSLAKVVIHCADAVKTDAASEFRLIMSYILDRQLHLHSSAYQAVTEAYAKLNDLENAKLYYRKFKESRKHGPPPLEIYLVMLTMFKELRLSREGEEIFEELCAHHCPNEAHSILLKLYIRCREVKKAEKYFEYMKTIKVDDIPTNITMLRHFLYRGDVNKAEECLSKLSSERCNLPRYYSYLIHAYRNKASAEKIEELIAEMQEKSLEPDFMIYSAYMEAKGEVRTDSKVRERQRSVQTGKKEKSFESNTENLAQIASIIELSKAASERRKLPEEKSELESEVENKVDSNREAARKRVEALFSTENE